MIIQESNWLFLSFSPDSASPHIWEAGISKVLLFAALKWLSEDCCQLLADISPPFMTEDVNVQYKSTSDSTSDSLFSLVCWSHRMSLPVHQQTHTFHNSLSLAPSFAPCGTCCFSWCSNSWLRPRYASPWKQNMFFLWTEWGEEEKKKKREKKKKKQQASL